MLDCVACKEKINKLTYVVLHTFTSFFSFGSQIKWLLIALNSNYWMGICLGRLSIARFTEVVVWTGFTVMLHINWVQMFKCIISHSSKKSLVPPLHKFTIQKLFIFFSFFGKLNLLNMCTYWLVNISGGWKKNCPIGK